jgi:hypothetical protein
MEKSSVADPRCLSLSRIRIRLFSIPDPRSEFFYPGSQIRIKEFKYFNPKKWFLSSRKYDPGCSSRFPGSKRHRARIPDPDPQHWKNRLW